MSLSPNAQREENWASRSRQALFLRIYGRNAASSAATIRQARIANAVTMSLRRSSRWLIRRRPSPAVAGWNCIERVSSSPMRKIVLLDG